MALPSEPPAISTKAYAFARGLDRPRYALLDALDDLGLDDEFPALRRAAANERRMTRLLECLTGQVRSESVSS
jgi:hypothetical protein